jgi:D-alanine transfer protein
VSNIDATSTLAWRLLSAGTTTTTFRTDLPGDQVGAPEHRPVGILAALLALAIAVGVACAGRLYARRLAARHAHGVAGAAGAIKSQTLILQRAAFANAHLLPVYGSSELYCCGDPYRATQVFASEPTGFDAFAVGQAGVANLLFMEAFGALGHALDAKKLVLLDSPPWFAAREDYRAAAYASNFSSEIAEAFVFTAPVSDGLREAGARRMLGYPQTLQGNLVLRLSVRALARPTLLHRALYRTLAPLGRVEEWVEESRDAVRTLLFIRRYQQDPAGSTARPARLDWVALAASATQIAASRDTTNPFGLSDDAYRQMLQGKRGRSTVENALAAYRAGITNRDGQLYPAPADWQARMPHSPEWTDLRLATAVLSELGAEPFILTMPLNGFYHDYTPLSAPARRAYYDRWEHVVRRTGFPWLDFRAADEDPYFMSDSGGHLGPRGWIFADRALDMFWRGRPIDEIRDAVTALAARVPSPPAAAVSEEVSR